MTGQYNSSVREFDVVTLDMHNLMEIEPELAVWLDAQGREVARMLWCEDVILTDHIS